MSDENFLVWLDNWLFDFLVKNAEGMPIRLCKLIASCYTDARIRKLYWQRLGVTMGENTYANLGMKVVAGGKGTLIIGDNVSIAPNVTFVLLSESNNGVEINAIPYVSEKLKKDSGIVVEDEVWLGTGVTILPGCHIGRCSVIGAGAVVTNNVDSYSIYAGIPAKKIRDLHTERA